MVTVVVDSNIRSIINQNDGKLILYRLLSAQRTWDTLVFRKVLTHFLTGTTCFLSFSLIWNSNIRSTFTQPFDNYHYHMHSLVTNLSLNCLLQYYYHETQIQSQERAPPPLLYHSHNCNACIRNSFCLIMMLWWRWLLKVCGSVYTDFLSINHLTEPLNIKLFYWFLSSAESVWQ